MENKNGQCFFETLSWGEQLSLIRAVAARLNDIDAVNALLITRTSGGKTYSEVPDKELIAELRQQLIDAANLTSFMVCGQPTFIEVSPLDFPPSDPTQN